MSEKDDVVRRLEAGLDAAARLRAGAVASPVAKAAWEALRVWQAARLARTHAGLLANPETVDAAKFFLTDLYAPGDLSRRDALAKRVAPIMSKMLPVSALETIADAIELDALSESLDAAMVAALGGDIARIDAAAYGRAYRAVAREPDRARQIDLIAHLGASIERLARLRFIGATLSRHAQARASRRFRRRPGLRRTRPCGFQQDEDCGALHRGDRRAGARRFPRDFSRATILRLGA